MSEYPELYNQTSQNAVSYFVTLPKLVVGRDSSGDYQAGEAQCRPRKQCGFGKHGIGVNISHASLRWTPEIGQSDKVYNP